VTRRASSIPPTARENGFTLLELLVVVVILGIAAGVVSLSVSPSEDRLVAEEAERLGALFRLAQDEARISARPLTWEADTRGYRFVGSDGVRSDNPDDPLRPRDWPFHVQRVIVPRLVFGAEPLLQPCEIQITTLHRELVLRLDAFGMMTVSGASTLPRV
jgi:general secretion pathway protein H